VKLNSGLRNTAMVKKEVWHGPADQPALHGLLVRIPDLGLPLISVECLETFTGEKND
jgi:hypothetical protein